MAVNQIMHRALGQYVSIKIERSTSPNADLTPVYVGKFCYIGKLALDELDFIDQKILGLAVLILTVVVSTKKGSDAFKWIPEFVLPLAQIKILAKIQGRYMVRTDKGLRFKSEEDCKKNILYSALAVLVFQCFNNYLQSTRNPKLTLKTAIPLSVARMGYSTLFQLYHTSIKQASDKLSKQYSFEVISFFYGAGSLLTYYTALKGIERAVGASVLTNWKFITGYTTVNIITQILMHSPNSPFKEEG